MTSRDERASYYDLELPDGTRTEVWAVLRAVLSPEEAVGYTKGCLLTRIMRDGRKDVDRLREAEKVGIEAGMLREAMEAHLSSVDAVADRECERFIAELERERDEARARAAELERALNALRQTLVTERQAAVATAEELKRVRRELADLRETYDAEMAYRDWKCCELGAHEGEAFDTFLRRVCTELSALRNRTRPRRQSEEPAQKGASVLRWVSSPWASPAPRWVACHEQELLPVHIWTHQPPAPGEGE